MAVPIRFFQFRFYGYVPGSAPVDPGGGGTTPPPAGLSLGGYFATPYFGGYFAPRYWAGTPFPGQSGGEYWADGYFGAWFTAAYWPGTTLPADGLIGAIQNWWLADPTMATFAGRIYQDEAPADAALPYAVVKVSSSNIAEAYSDATWHDTVAEFRVYATTAEEADHLTDVAEPHLLARGYTWDTGVSALPILRGRARARPYGYDPLGNKLYSATITMLLRTDGSL